MKRPLPPGWHFLQYLTYLIGLVLLCSYLLSAVLTQAAENPSDGPTWANPGPMAVQKVGAVDPSRHEPNFLNNLDCQSLTYRVSPGSAMQTGCFTETAFGLIDSDSDTVLFNGTDEGLPLLPYSAHEVLVPWPKAGALLALDAANTGGSYINLYRNPLSVLQDQRNGLQLTAKQLTAAPELAAKDPEGKQLVINPQTMAFSDDGSWMAVETLSGSFVRINLATLDITAFAQAFGSQGSPGLLKSQVALSENGRYAAIYNEAAGSLKVYDLATCAGSTIGLQPQQCASYDYLPFIRQRLAGLQSVRHMRFVNEGLLSFEVSGDSSASGTYELAPAGKITSLIDYLGLGDSYTSGEGAFDYLAGTDTADNRCHLSVHSYPLLLARDLFGGTGGHSVACSGAEVNDVSSTSSTYRGQVRGAANFQQLQHSQSIFLGSIMAGYLPGYVAQQRFVQQYQPALTTVSVGGNDIGFGDILRKCVAPHVSLHLSGNTCYNTYEDRLEVTQLIDRTIPRWTALYKELLAKAPGTRLYVIGYPQIVDHTGDCALNVHLNKSELAFSEELIDYLNDAIRQAADGAGVTYVDISQALAGHRLCETAAYDVAVNGLTAGTDGAVAGIAVFGQESYHPNALGQALIEQAILKQTHNLAAAGPGGAADRRNVLDAPKSGRTVNTLVPDDSLSTPVLSGTVTVTANGSRDGLKPNTLYAITLDGPSGPLLGTSLSDNAATISANVTLPAGIEPGGHTIDVTGRNEADEPVDVSQPIYAPFTDDDADGDGVPDVLDSCPGAANSGQDNDGDGVDDTCDSLIGAPVSSGTQSGPSAQAAPGGGNAATTGTGAGQPKDSDSSLDINNSSLAVSSLSVGGGPTINIPPAGKDKGDARTIDRALGNATINPSAVTAADFSAPAGKRPSSPPRVYAELFVIKWWLWMGLAAVLWLVLIIGLWAQFLLDTRRRSRQTAGSFG